VAEKTIGLIGGRGYVGGELLPLIAAHPGLRLAFIGSRGATDSDFDDLPDGVPVLAIGPDTVAAIIADREPDLLVLAVPNGAVADYARALKDAPCRLLDISADHRFDGGWQYGLPERFRDRIAGARRLANPGCYATAAQLALLPLLGALDGLVTIFGVSGYSGAGRTPGPRNDPERLADNLLPYGLMGHGHEREIAAQLGRRIRFLPHVGPFFRGLSLTISGRLKHTLSVARLQRLYSDFYAGERLVTLSTEPPEIRDVRATPTVAIGGFCTDGRDFALAAALDNLLKGAASQALQNINLMLGFDELTGLGARRQQYEQKQQGKNS